jgi:hypothetical protein
MPAVHAGMTFLSITSGSRHLNSLGGLFGLSLLKPFVAPFDKARANGI